MAGGGLARWGSVALAGLAVLVLSAPPASGTARQWGVGDRTTAPEPVVSPALVSAVAGRADASLLVPGGWLPFTYHVERSLAARMGLDTVVSAMASFDGVTGSRWATKFGGLVDDGDGTARKDGRSVVFAANTCGDDVGGFVRRHTPFARDTAYGGNASYLQEADIGLCPSVRTPAQARRILAHEVGHVLGMDHLCEPGQGCWLPGMGPGPHRCRIMYHGQSRCPQSVQELDREALRTLYPTLRRLAGPTRYETAARVSYATFSDGGAGTVVVARGDGSAHGPLAAAALAGARNAPLLLGTPAGGQCVQGPARDEIDRVTRLGSRVVFVGDWPSACDTAFHSRLVFAERVTNADPVRLSVAVADRVVSARRGSAAFLVSMAADRDGNVPDGVAAGAVGGAHGAPILYTHPERLSDPVRQWLESNPRVGTVYLMGGTAALGPGVAEAVSSMGRRMERLAGKDRVGTALALADRSELFPQRPAVVLAPAAAWADAVAGGALAARRRAPLLLSGPAAAPAVEDWLRRRAPYGGFVVGGQSGIPQSTQTRYTRHVR